MKFASGLFLAFWLLTSVSAQTRDWCKSQPRPAYNKLERLKTPDQWFEVYKIRPGVFAIYEPHQFEDAYVASVKKMVGLAARLQLLLHSHNVPLAEPDYRPRVLGAIQQVRGHVKSVAKDGNREYMFEGFSFLMSQ
jgi:hypothetical protein